MNSKATSQRIKLFEKRFGEPHFFLACHAAFPQILTPDLLYLLWANFQTNIYGQFLDIPWIAVADLLCASGLCNEVGVELYEMDRDIRDNLIQQLAKNPNFGSIRIQELAYFLLQYIEEKQELYHPDPDIRDIAQAQLWTSLAYTSPSLAAREIALTLSQLERYRSKSEKHSELVRIKSLLETLAEALLKTHFQSLSIYTCGMLNYVSGDVERAIKQLGRVIERGQIQVAHVKLPIPEFIEEKLRIVRKLEQGNVLKEASRFYTLAVLKGTKPLGIGLLWVAILQKGDVAFSESVF